MKKALFFVAAALMGLAVNAQDTLLFENFEGVQVNNQGMGSIPASWTVYEDNNENYHSNQGDLRPFGKGWTVYDLGGASKCALSITYTMTQYAEADRWLITPQLTVPTDDYKLVFQVYTSGYYEGLAVLVSTNGTDKANFTDTLMNEFPTDDAMHLFDLSAYAGQNIHIAFVNNTLNAMCTFIAVDDIIVTRSWPANDIIMYSDFVQRNVSTNTTFNASVVAYNNGSDTLRTFEIVYGINNETPDTMFVDTEIAPFSYQFFDLLLSHPTAEAGTLHVTAINPNDTTDDHPADNTITMSVNVYDPSTTVARTSLLDHFTTAVCQYCPGGHETLEAAMEGYEDKIAWVAHHLGYYEDAMLLDEDYNLYSLYGSSSWAPAMALDRDPYYARGEEGVVGSVSSVARVANYFADATAVPTYVNLNVTKDSYDPQTRQLTVTVSGNFIETMNIPDPRLTIYVTEDGITYRQQSTDQVITNYKHNHVARGLMTSLWGDNDVITSTEEGSNFSKTYTYTLPTRCHADKVRVVAFISNYNSSILNRMVAQAAKTDYIFEGTDPTQSNVGINGVETSLNITTYPNPATEMAYIDANGETIRSYEVVNALGQKVIDEKNVNVNTIELNVSGMPQGVYFVTVATDRGMASQRLTIVK